MLNIKVWHILPNWRWMQVCVLEKSDKDKLVIYLCDFFDIDVMHHLLLTFDRLDVVGEEECVVGEEEWQG